MRLIPLETPDQVGDWAARYVMKRIMEFQPRPDKKYFCLGLPTGSTPLPMYRKLVQFHEQGKLSFRHVRTFNMDEYIGLEAKHPQSYHFFMFEHFFKHIDIDPENVFILDGMSQNLDRECEQFEERIRESGGVDLFIGGIGADGHIAFNEPGSSLTSRTRIKTLAVETIKANARFFDDDQSQVPTQCLTVGVGTVMDAREVMILITSQSKALALHHAIEQGVNHMWTVSAFQMHPRAMFVVDEDATLELKVKTVKYFKGLFEIHQKLVE